MRYLHRGSRERCNVASWYGGNTLQCLGLAAFMGHNNLCVLLCRHAFAVALAFVLPHVTYILKICISVITVRKTWPPCNNTMPLCLGLEQHMFHPVRE